MTEQQQEWLGYGVAVAGLVGLAMWQRSQNGRGLGQILPGATSGTALDSWIGLPQYRASLLASANLSLLPAGTLPAPVVPPGGFIQPSGHIFNPDVKSWLKPDQQSAYQALQSGKISVADLMAVTPGTSAYQTKYGTPTGTAPGSTSAGTVTTTSTEASTSEQGTVATGTSSGLVSSVQSALSSLTGSSSSTGLFGMSTTTLLLLAAVAAGVWYFTSRKD